jgi:Xaa-Pro aminopeptidase
MTTVAERLSHAQSKAALLFREIEARQIIRAGQSEAQISDAIHEIGRAKFGVEKHWHRRVVRSGPNTRLQFRELPPDRVVGDDDIVSLDLGPVFGDDEADFGRTYVVGDDPAKLRLRDDLALLFDACRNHYFDRPSMTGSELFEHVLLACKARGWGFGGSHAGHLVGPFPFSRTERDAPRNRIRGDNVWPMNDPGDDAEPRHWILEIHLLDPTGAFGGFYEELLTR